jgi:hypothetical protein
MVLHLNKKPRHRFLHQFRYLNPQHGPLDECLDSVQLRLPQYNCEDYHLFHRNRDQPQVSTVTQVLQDFHCFLHHLQILVFSVFNLPRFSGDEAPRHPPLDLSAPMDLRPTVRLGKFDRVHHL